MRSKLVRWLGLVALTWAVLAVAIGCAQERNPINRVQALALSKHFFVGASLSDPSDDPEFYMGTRVIDEPLGVGQDFGMFQAIGGLSRIKWEIEESVLIARLTYERIQNSDHHGSQATNNGQVVAEFTIQSHFDIIRDYNPQTGEQLNVVVENTTDRPWYEREYFRVDWSKNLVTDAYDFDMLAVGAALDGIKYDPLSYYVEDPKDPNAPVFSDADGYLDVTTKVFATPQIVDTPYGKMPACMFYESSSYPTDTCNPAEVTLRLAFKKVVDHDFEPENVDGNKMQAFGWFTQDRYGYDRNYGIVDQAWHRYASKYNIWQKSHVDGTQCAIDHWRDASGNVQNYKVGSDGKFVFDPHTGLPIVDPNGQPFTLSAPGQDVHRDVNPKDGTEDECEFKDASGNVINAGSRCDEFTNKCDLPLYVRSTKTTPLYYGPTAPPDLFPSTAHALNSWNIAVKRAAQIGKLQEATRVGLAVGQSPPITDEAALLADQQNGTTVPDIFVLCHNPVTKGDPAACGPAGLAVRLGDLRYHIVDVIQTPQHPSAWGVMSDFDDPLTGEKVQASINEWAYVLDIASQNVEDLLRWINGEITSDQIASGQYMQQWLQASRLGAAQYAPTVLSPKEIQSRLNSIDSSSAKLNGLTSSTLPRAITRQTAAQNLSTSLGPSLDAKFQATTQATLGTQWEARLLTPNMLQKAGLDPTRPFAGDPTALSMASPLRGMNPRLMKWGRGVLDAAQVTMNMCVMKDEPEPDSLVGLARQAAQLFPKPQPSDANYPAELFQRDQSLHQWIREQFHLSVIAHEMGHSMGLRHNFAGSYDALNYHTEYWQLRTRNGAEHYCGRSNGVLDAMTPHTNGTDCVGPRWVDPVTDQEVNDFIWKWGSTTVMDYPGDQTQDMNDIGLYDKAAMRFGYADIVDVENNKQYVSDYLPALDGFGGILGNAIGQAHYTTYADKFGLLGDCSKARPGWNGDPNDPLAKQCTGPDLDYVPLRDMRTVDKFGPQITQVRPDLVANFGLDAKGRVRHPYMFGGDEFADVGNVPVFRFDAGADSYEQFQFLISTYENRYIFNNFRRNRVTFQSNGVVSYLEDRYWNKIQALSKSLALGIELDTTAGSANMPANDPKKDPGQLMPLALGSADAFAMFARAITRPGPGPYVTTPPSPGGAPNPWGRVWRLGDPASVGNLAPPNGVNIALGNGQGRYNFNDYDYTQGYWFSQYQKQVGSAYEKTDVVGFLLEAYNNFISNLPEDYIDGRYKNLNYASIYPQQVRRLLANVMVAQSPTPELDQSTVAQIYTIAPYSLPAATSPANPNPITDVQYLPWDKYDPTDPSTTQLSYPPGAVLLDPLLGWEQQYRALIDAFTYAPTTLTMDFIDQIRIFSPGDAASLSIPTAQQVAYRDPTTGIEYVARNYGAETINPAVGYPAAKTIGSRMIQYANLLAQTAYQVKTTDPTTGELVYVTDLQGNPVPNQSQTAQDAATMLRGFTANVDVVRQLTLFYGYGPLSSGGSSGIGP
jgi:hypothetical protein